MGWKERLLIRNSIVDKQHIEMFAMIDSIRDKYFLDKDELKNIFNYLRKYTEQHFRAEEDLMIRLKCNFYKKHKKQHEHFESRRARCKGKSNSEEPLFFKGVSFSIAHRF